MPLEFVAEQDPLTSMIHIHSSAVYELVVGMSAILFSPRRSAEAARAQGALSPELMEAATSFLEPFRMGLSFTEVPVDYPNHDDVPGFIQYVRDMDDVDFIFYVVGRVLTREQIREADLDFDTLLNGLSADSSRYEKWRDAYFTGIPLREILADVATFKNRLADLWQWYWEDYLSTQIEQFRTSWNQAIAEKENILQRDGALALIEQVTGKAVMPDAFPGQYPVADIRVIPINLSPDYKCQYFFGYGNVTVLFDSQRSEMRVAELKESREVLLGVAKALGDRTRLRILRRIASAEGKTHGKEIARELDLSASAISRHLSQLRDSGLIEEEPLDNRVIAYRIRRDVIEELPEKLLDYVYG